MRKDALDPGISERAPRAGPWKKIRAALAVFGAAARIWVDHQAFVYAAALAFFTVFSVAPVTIVAVAIIGVVLGEDAAHGRLMQQLADTIGAAPAAAIQEAVMNSRPEISGIWPTVLGIGAILVGATTVFAYLQKSLNAIWDVVPRPTRTGITEFVRNRVLSLAIVLAIGFILLVSLLFSVAVQSVLAYAHDEIVPLPTALLTGIEVFVSLVVISLLFGAMFRILPDVVLDWSDVVIGAVITGVLFSAGRIPLAFYLANTATASTYGAAGSLVLLLLWVNYSSLILLYGAAFIRAQREARGKSVVPRKGAVMVSHELIVERES
jgi:membrane protein